jgi:hypothetical protein
MKKTIFFNDNDGAHQEWQVEVEITVLNPSEYSDVYFCWDDLNEDKNKGNIAFTSLDVLVDGKPYIQDKVLSYTDWDNEGPIYVHYWWYKKLFPCPDPNNYLELCDLVEEGLAKETNDETLIFEDYNNYKTWREQLPDGYPGK